MCRKKKVVANEITAFGGLNLISKISNDIAYDLI
jgi:hypothetical protein